MAKTLTDAGIRRYRPAHERRRFRDGGARSLFLVVEPSGHKAFEMRFRHSGGKISKIRLGPFDLSGRELEGTPAIGQPLTLAAARMLAADVLRRRALGVDVIGEHRAAKRRERAEAVDRDASTFGAAVHDYAANYVIKKTGQRPRGLRATVRLLGLQIPKDGGKPAVIRGGLVERWGDKPVHEVDVHLVQGVVDEAQRSASPGIGSSREQSDNRARLLFVALSSLFSWLHDKRRVDINPLKLAAAPATARSRDRVLSNDEIRIFWRACEELPDTHKAILRLLLLTGGRRSEVNGMTRAELGAEGTWSLSGARTKNKLPHVVPLAPAAQAIIGALPRIESAEGFVFTKDGKAPVGGWSRHKHELDVAMNKIARQEGLTIAPWRVHDLRRSFVTGCAELGIPPNVIELAVNHVSGHKAGIAGIYNKSTLLPERRMALTQWADHVEGLVGERPATKVVLIAKGRRRG